MSFSQIIDQLVRSAAFTLFLFAAASVEARTFYVSPDGCDSRSGLSPVDAWQTLAPVNGFDFEPGDSILLEGGRIFQGPLQLDADDSGVSGNPVTVGTYRLEEAGPAIVRAGLGRGLEVHNASALHLRDLKIIGDGPKVNRQSGLLLLSSGPGGQNIDITRIEITGFGKHGISIGAWNTREGYHNVRIVECLLHDNRLTGVYTWGPWGRHIYAHRKIYIGDTRAHGMKGGSGLTLSSVDGGIIERCIVYDNGAEHSGGAGIWAWDSNDILFQYNESYDNKTTGADGDGFDFDGGVTNSVMQYNYSHDNAAAGFLLAQYKHAPQAMENIIVRFNISENDCRTKPYGAIHVWNGDRKSQIRNVQIYQNTVYMKLDPAEEPGFLTEVVHAGLEVLGFVQMPTSPCAVAVISPTSDVAIFNNLFFTSGQGRLMTVVRDQSSLRFQNNAYWSDDGIFRAEWMGKTYDDIQAWLADAADQERDGDQVVALFADPMLTAPGTGGTIGRPGLLSGLDGYRLRQGSPLRGRGLNLIKLPDSGDRGFFGTPISENARPVIGAHYCQGT